MVDRDRIASRARGCNNHVEREAAISAWDILDKRFGRKPEPARAVPLAVGDPCPAPMCRGRLRRWIAFWDDTTLICDACGWHESDTSAAPFPDVIDVGLAPRASTRPAVIMSAGSGPDTAEATR